MTHLGPPPLVFPRLHKATEAQQQYLHVGSDKKLQLCSLKTCIEDLLGLSNTSELI